MATENFDLFEVTLVGDYLGQQVRNVFHYRYIGDALLDFVGAEEIANSFVSTFFGASGSALRSGVFSDQIFYRSLRVKNLFDVGEFTESLFPTPFSGVTTSEGAPPFISVGYRTPWLGGEVRRGMKRFSGVAEAAYDSGVLNSFATAGLNSLRSALGSSLVVDAGQAVPVIVGRIKYTTSDGKEAYRLPENLAQATRVGSGTVWEYLPRVTTQNSRKVGRGI